MVISIIWPNNDDVNTIKEFCSVIFVQNFTAPNSVCFSVIIFGSSFLSFMIFVLQRNYVCQVKQRYKNQSLFGIVCKIVFQTHAFPTHEDYLIIN